MPASGSSTRRGSRASTRLHRRILGIDASFTRTGIVIWDGTLVYAVDVKTTPAHSDEERIAAIAGSVMEARTKVHPLKIHGAVVEGYSTGPRSGRKVLTRLGELGGVIKHWLWVEGVPFVTPAPSQVKEFATGFGDASKSTMLRVARRYWPECPHDDLADAFHMARMGFERFDELFGGN